jgi:hypothetical protein
VSESGSPNVTARVTATEPRLERRVAAALLTTALLPFVACGQQFVWSVPSADVLNPKQMAVEFYGSLGTLTPDNSSVSPRFILGAGHGVELGLDFAGNVNPSDTSTLDLAWKWKVYNGGGNGWAVLLGGAEYVPVLHRSYRFSDYTYLQAAKTFRGQTRITAGPNLYTPGAVVPGAFRAGVQAAVEQPLGKVFTISGDWISGRHDAGYTTIGMYALVRKGVYFSVGYALGNSGVTQGNQYLLLALTIYSK